MFTRAVQQVEVVFCVGLAQGEACVCGVVKISRRLRVTCHKNWLDVLARFSAGVLFHTDQYFGCAM
jgi:hypothetical protein